MTSRMRVSCAALCRIMDGNGRYFLAVNENRIRRGLRVLTPIGGGLEVTNPQVFERFDAQLEIPDSYDLRFFVDSSRLNDFGEWFRLRQERETSPMRELQEELVDEFNVLEGLEPSDVAINYLNTYEHERKSSRSTAPGALTRYFIETYEVQFKNAAMRAILEAEQLDDRLHWVTVDTIRRGQTPDGVHVDAALIL